MNEASRYNTEVFGERMDVVAACDFDVVLRRLEESNKQARRLEQFRAYVQAVCANPNHRTGYTLLQACAFLDEIARQAVAAASPIDADVAGQKYCRRELLALGKTAPRTCQRCGLMGPCTGVLP